MPQVVNFLNTLPNGASAKRVKTFEELLTTLNAMGPGESEGTCRDEL